MVFQTVLQFTVAAGDDHHRYVQTGFIDGMGCFFQRAHSFTASDQKCDRNIQRPSQFFPYIIDRFLFVTEFICHRKANYLELFRSYAESDAILAGAFRGLGAFEGKSSLR